MKNEFEVREGVTAVLIKRKDGSVIETLISTQKLKKVQEYPNTWCAQWNKETRSFYVMSATHKVDGKYKTAYLHRWITDCPKDMVVDHINHDTLDNTDGNLRVVTGHGNMRNQTAHRNNKTGILGVYWNKREKKYVARLKVNGVVRHFGYFKNIEDAVKARKQAEIKYWNKQPS